MTPAKDTIGPLIVDREACPIKYRDRDGDPRYDLVDEVDLAAVRQPWTGSAEPICPSCVTTSAEKKATPQRSTASC